MSQLSNTNTTSEEVPAMRWVLLGCMAVLAPLVADGLHSVVVVSRGIWFYQAEFSDMGDWRYWIFIGIRAALSFLVLCLFAEVPFRHRLAWVCCVVGWTFLAFQGEAVFK